MLIIAVISAITLILIFKEMKPMYQNEKKTFWVYTVILGFAFILWCLNGLNVKIPSPADPIKDAVKAIFGLKE